MIQIVSMKLSIRQNTVALETHTMINHTKENDNNQRNLLLLRLVFIDATPHTHKHTLRGSTKKLAMPSELGGERQFKASSTYFRAVKS